MSLNIVIIGVGEVGFNLAKYLSKEDHAITVIDVNPKKCLRVQNSIDAKVILRDSILWLTDDVLIKRFENGNY